MEHPKTEAIRPVGAAMHKAVGALPTGAFNFGLYFNKWMYIVDGASLGDGWGRKNKPWSCAISDKTKVFGNRGEDWCEPNTFLDNFNVSIALFNSPNNGQIQYERGKPVRQHNGKYKERKRPISIPARWDRTAASSLLAARHNALDAIAASFAAVGYEYIKIEAEMLSPLVIGLGNEHPTEKGFRFDWTLGIPVVPATSIKGVVRLAWLVDRLNEKPEAEARRFWDEISGRWKKGRRDGDKPAESILPKEAKQLFGSGEIVRPDEQKNSRGKVVFFDALPATLPRLKAEIMNCHYPDYLNKKPGDREFRGPTEDQDPNPQKFWAVDDSDDQRKSLNFVFRILVHRSITDDPDSRSRLERAIEGALREHGLGAKTSIGHGRFCLMKSDRSDAKGVDNPNEGQTKDEPPEHEIWKNSTLTWSPGDQEINVRYEGKKALAKGKDLVPPGLQKLFKKKSAKADIEVEPYGNVYRIVKIMEPSG